MRFIGITFFLLLSLKPCYANIFNKKNKLQEVEQLVVVTTENWKSTKGKLMCF